MKKVLEYLFEGSNIYWTIITIVFVELLITRDYDILTVLANLVAWGIPLLLIKQYVLKKAYIKK